MGELLSVEPEVAHLLRSLAARDVRVRLVDGNLKVDGPRGAVDDKLRAALREHKPALVRHLERRAAPPLVPCSRESAPPASFAQQRLWFLEQLERGNGYAIPIAFALSGPVDPKALRGALERIVARHEVLRTRLVASTADATPRQVIDDLFDARLELVDLRGEPDPDATADARAHELAWAPFDLEAGPLFRAALMQTGAETYRLVLCFHHTIFDGWSLGVFLDELAYSYEALRRGATPALPDLPLHYADFAVWQRRALTGERLERLRTYWRERLAGAPPLIELPTDRPRPPLQSFAGARVSRVLSPELALGLRELGRAHRVTPTTAALGAFAVLLSRHTGADDLVIGMPIANRGHAQLERLIGFFANTLALRVRVAAAQSVDELLDDLREVMRGAQLHQELPFERVVDALEVERNLDRNPLFQVMFADIDNTTDDFSLVDLDVSLVEPEHQHSGFDLTLNLRRGRGRVEAIFEYSTALFDAATIERLADSFLTLVAGILERPDAAVGSLPVLSERALLEVVRDFNATAVHVDPGPLVHEHVRRQAAAQPTAEAIRDGDRGLTYAELQRRVDELSIRLHETGVGPGQLVAILLPRSAETVIAMLAVLTAGAAYVPLDPEQPQRRLEFMLEDSRACVVLTSAELRERARGGGRQVLEVAEDGPPVPTPSSAAPAAIGPESLAYVIYTSGSTGKPKGVMIRHAAVRNTLLGYRLGYRLAEHGAGLSHLQMANPAFDVFTGDWLRSLCTGGRLVICPMEHLALPERLYATLVGERIGFAEFVPAVIRRLCDHLEATGARLDFMRGVVVSSDVFHVRDYRRLRALCTADAQVTNTYGVTEAAIDSTIAERIDVELTGDAIAPIGRPMANTRTYVLDHALRPVPVGVRGELCLAGSGLADGYLEREALSRERFVEVELLGHRERVYRTGDAARWRPGGELEFFGRLDHQINLRGLRIELGEIEAALLEHGSIREAVVVLRGDPPEPMLVAYVALNEELADISRELRGFLDERIPRYMIPAVFIVLPALPLNANGKIDRASLPAPTNAVVRSLVPPRDSVELKLLLIWERLLERAPLSVVDDFFALGGDSLLSVRLVSVLERELGVRVPLSTVFQTGTIERLAAWIRRRDEEPSAAPWSPLVCLQPRGDAAPLFFVHAAGGIVFRYLEVAALLGDARPFYALQARGVEPGDLPYPSIEVMAADYVRAIREVQPRGPYLLGGWSFGGTVAFEMARQLEAVGEAAPVLLMVDAPSPFVDDYEEDDVEFLLERLRPAAGLELADVDGHDTREAKLRYLFEEQRLAGLFVPDISEEDAALRLALHKHHNRIICEYRPAGPCASRIVFFAPTEAIPFDRRMGDPVPAWEAFADGVEVHSAPGNHFNMFSAKNGPVLADRLREAIARLAR